MRTSPTVATVLLLLAACTTLGADVSEPDYRSKAPLYFRIAFGKEGTPSMLVALDDANDIGPGYDVAYVDENLNGDLTDDSAKRVYSLVSGGQSESRFSFDKPIQNDRAKCTLRIRPRAYKSGYCQFYWDLDVRGWSYAFRDGRMRLYASAAEALRSDPVRLASACKWDMGATVRDNKVYVSARLEDANGCMLRTIRNPLGSSRPTFTVRTVITEGGRDFHINRRSEGTLTPMLTLARDGETVLHRAMEYG